MDNYNRNNRAGGGRGGSGYGGRGGGGRSFGGGRDFDRPTLYNAKCAKCGNDCQVPFKPTGERPVYCSNCFESMRGGDDNGRGPRRDFGRPGFNDSHPRPYSRDNGGTPPGQNNGQVMELLNNLQVKMDKILSALAPKAVKPRIVKKKGIEKKEEKAEKVDKVGKE